MLLACLLAAVLLQAASPPPPPVPLGQRLHDRCRELLDRGTPGLERTDLVLGEHGWLLLREELEYLVAGRFWEDDAARSKTTAVAPPSSKGVGSLPAILDFARQLSAMGIELVVVPVPPRPLVYPESLLADAQPGAGVPLAQDHRAFLARLESERILTVDLVPVLAAGRGHEHGPVFRPTDSHWSGFGVALAAEAVAKRIRERPWYRQARVQPLPFTTRWRNGAFPADLLQRLEDRAQEPPAYDVQPRRVSFREVRVAGAEGDQALAMRNPSSPVVVIGDSYVIAWTNLGAGLSQQLAYELGFPVDDFHVRGGGANAARMNLVREQQSNRTYLGTKKLVVWCFAGRILNHTRWQIIPLSRP